MNGKQIVDFLEKYNKDSSIINDKDYFQDVINYFEFLVDFKNGNKSIEDIEALENYEDFGDVLERLINEDRVLDYVFQNPELITIFGVLLDIDKILESHPEQLFNYVKNNADIGDFKNNIKIFEYIYSKDNNLAYKFNIDYILGNADKEFIERHEKLILDYLENVEVKDDLNINSYIVSFLREHKRYDLIKKFNLVLKLNFDELSDNELEEYKDWILEYIENNNFLVDQFEKNHVIFNWVKEYKKELLYKFDLRYFFPELNDDIIKEYSNEIFNYLKRSHYYIPSKWLESKLFFDFILKKDKSILVNVYIKNISYLSSILPKLSANEIKEYGNLLAILLKKTNYFLNDEMDLYRMFPVLTNDILEKCGDLIVLYLERGGRNYWSDNCLVDYLISRNQENLIFKTDINKIILKMIEENLEKYAHIIIRCMNKNLISRLANNEDMMDFLIKNNQIHLLNIYSDLKSYIETDEKMQLLANALGVDKNILKYKLDYLYSRNDEIYNTLDFRILKYNNIDINVISIVSVYPLIQEKILKLDNDLIAKFFVIMKKINTSKYDLSYVFELILNNIENYTELLNKISLDKLSDEQFKNLVLVLQSSDNKFEIKNEEDLLEDKFNRKKNEYYETIKENIDNIDIEKLKQEIVEKIYGIDYSMAVFIVKRYSSTNPNFFETLKENGLDDNTISIIKFLTSIVNEEDIAALKMMYLLNDHTNTIPELETDFYSAISLEAIIRKQYAKMYTKTLYELNAKDKSNNTKLQNVEYGGKKIQFYEAPDEFNMQIHCLGAYRDWSRPDNFLDDWNRPKISYHGICTSYIGNNQIATARISHPVLGFSEYEESALLLAGNYDLFSDGAIDKYSSSYYQPYNLLPPKAMIDSTRHNHNEMVIERKNHDYAISYKRLPNYIIYFVDDMNNMDNFSESNELYQETLQAAADFNLPIVIVDRLKCAKNEIKKCYQLEKEFYQTRDIKKLKELFLNYMNNAVGCRYFDGQKHSQYHDIFSGDVINKFFQRIVEFIKESINKGDMDNIDNIISSLIELIKHEQESYDVSHASYRITPELDLKLAESNLSELYREYQNKRRNTNNEVDEDIVRKSM